MFHTWVCVCKLPHLLSNKVDGDKMSYKETIRNLHEEVKFIEDIDRKIEDIDKGTAAILLRDASYVLRSLAGNLEQEIENERMTKLP